MGFDDWLYNVRDKNAFMMRQPEAHNTVVSKDRKWTNNTIDSCRITKYYFDDNVLSLKAEHNRIKGTRVERFLILIKHNILFVIDRITTDTPQTFCQLFHVPNSIEKYCLKKNVFSTANEKVFLMVRNIDEESKSLLKTPQKVRGSEYIPSKRIEYYRKIYTSGYFFTVILFSDKPFYLEHLAVEVSNNDRIKIGYVNKNNDFNYDFILNDVISSGVIQYTRPK